MSDSAWKANLKAEHIFVVARLDKSHGGELSPQMITATKAYLSCEDARREVDRLNELNADKDCEYFWLTARFQREEVE